MTKHDPSCHDHADPTGPAASGVETPLLMVDDAHAMRYRPGDLDTSEGFLRTVQAVCVESLKNAKHGVIDAGRINDLMLHIDKLLREIERIATPTDEVGVDEVRLFTAELADAPAAEPETADQELAALRKTVAALGMVILDVVTEFEPARRVSSRRGGSVGVPVYKAIVDRDSFNIWQQISTVYENRIIACMRAEASENEQSKT